MDAAASTQSAPDRTRDQPDPRRWKILSVSLVVGFMALLDVSIVNIAIPSMQQGLHTSAGSIQWVVSGYALTFGLVLVSGGRLGDAYGRKRLMVTGLIGFVIASAAVGLAPSAPFVIGARLVQGMVAGLLTPQNSGLIQQLFRGPERGRAFGLLGFTVSVSSACGPVLGGAILALTGQDHGWRYLFLINVPIGLIALFFVVRLVPGRDEAVGGGDPRLDLPGALLLGAAVVAVLYPVVSIEGDEYWPLLGLALVPVLAWAFVRWERRVISQERPPLLDLDLLSQVHGYAGGLMIGALYFTGFTGVVLVTSYYLQDGLGAGPLHAGLLVAPFAVGSATSAPIAGNFVSSVGRRLTVMALSAVALGVAVFAVFGPTLSTGTLPWLMVPALLFAGLGGGAVVSPNLTLTLSDVPPRMGGAAGGALQTGQRIGASVGAAILMTAYSTTSKHHTPETGLRVALLIGVAVVVVALVVAARDWLRG